MIKKVNNRKILPLLLIMALLASFGCKKKELPPSSPPPQPRAKPATAKPPQTVQVQASSAKSAGGIETLLDFSNKKDPFKPFVAEPVPQAQTKRAGLARSGDILPIQSYEVNRFRISGIIAGIKENTALIIDPAGKGYVVREGMVIGINDGRIKRITPNAIEVFEQYRDDNGHLRKRSIVLSLPKKK